MGSMMKATSKNPDLRSDLIITNLSDMCFEERKESGLFDRLELEQAVAQRETSLTSLRDAIEWE